MAGVSFSLSWDLVRGFECYFMLGGTSIVGHPESEGYVVMIYGEMGPFSEIDESMWVYVWFLSILWASISDKSLCFTVSLNSLKKL